MVWIRLSHPCLQESLGACNRSTPLILHTKGLNTYSSEGPSSRTFICRPLSAGASRNQFQGHRFRARTVRVVSNELANVRVDVYHCHGLKAVSASCESQRPNKIPKKKTIDAYSSHRCSTTSSIDLLAQLPSIEVQQGGKDRLRDLRRNKHILCSGSTSGAFKL